MVHKIFAAAGIDKLCEYIDGLAADEGRADKERIFWQEKIDSLQDQIDALQKENNAMSISIEGLGMACSNSSNDNREIRNKLKTLEDETLFLRERLSRLEKENANLKAKNASLEKKFRDGTSYNAKSQKNLNLDDFDTDSIDLNDFADNQIDDRRYDNTIGSMRAALSDLIRKI